MKGLDWIPLPSISLILHNNVLFTVLVRRDGASVTSSKKRSEHCYNFYTKSITNTNYPTTFSL